MTEELSGDLPGLEDLGITPVTVEDSALPILRRYRSAFHFNKPIDDIEHSIK
jgi:hypothetical protein